VPTGVGNQNDMVGRFLADHPGTVIGTFAPEHAPKVSTYFGNYWSFDEDGKHYYNRGLTLSSQILQREGLLNCAAYLNSTNAPDDPWEAMKSLRDRVKRSRKVARPLHKDVISVLRHQRTVAQGFYQQRVEKRPPVSLAKQLEVYCLTEQLPDPDSRVTLSNQVDALGMRRSKIDWRVSDLERQSVRRLGQLIAQESERLGLPPLQMKAWLETDEPWHHRFKDRSHPSCATRMSVNPKTGVVDTHCQVHGVSGLFVAGSSTFPTAGYANPTLMIISMALRIADRLKDTQFHTEAANVLEPQSLVVQ
jgi:choline dehydrogenase-like flavoprotein